MGTRADYYVGLGKDADWIGSSAFDGYPHGVELIYKADSLESFKSAVAERLTESDGTTPDLGWPWPWENSQLTDYAYCWNGTGVSVFCFGRPVEFDAEGNEIDDKDYENTPEAEFPEFKVGMSAQAGSIRSGIMVIGTPGSKTRRF